MVKAKTKQLKNTFLSADVLSLSQYTPDDLDLLFKQTILVKNHKELPQLLQKTITTLLFFEPSSRTFGSFSAAIKRLGGQTLEFQNPFQTSSAAKGETLEDSIKMYEAYSDVLVIRHPEQGAAECAAASSSKPVINAGDGTGEHPTQAFLDLFTLFERFGKLGGLTGLLVGDLLNGRTVHSLIKGLSLYTNNTLYLLSPEQLRLPIDLKKTLSRSIKIIEISSEKQIPKNCHFWYWTRVQKERFSDITIYEKLKYSFILTSSLLKQYGNKTMVIMHPLPRVGEIETAVDSDPRAFYLTTQAHNGVYTRMALMSLVLGKLP